MVPTQKDEKLLKEKYKENYPDILQKIQDNYPIQYLIGNVEFYGYPIKVDERVLIPRFETELLIEKTIEYIKKKQLQKPNILDIGTGSGCVAITIKKEIDCAMTAIDVSSDALEVAKANAKENNADIRFHQKDILMEEIESMYDVIISNPPYLKEDDDVGKEIAYEPQIALYADHQGLLFYETIFKKAVNHISKNSLLAFEIGESQGTQLVELAKQYFPQAIITCEKDYSNKDRYLFIDNK